MLGIGGAERCRTTGAADVRFCPTSVFCVRYYPAEADLMQCLSNAELMTRWAFPLWS